MSADWTQLLLGPLGTLVLALSVIYAILKEWLVPGATFRRALSDKNDLIEDRDWWRDRTLDFLEVAKGTATVADKALSTTATGEGRSS